MQLMAVYAVFLCRHRRLAIPLRNGCLLAVKGNQGSTGQDDMRRDDRYQSCSCHRSLSLEAPRRTDCCLPADLCSAPGVGQAVMNLL